MKRKFLGLSLPAGLLAVLVAALCATPSSAYAGHKSYKSSCGSGYYYGYNNSYNCYPKSSYSFNFNYNSYNNCSPRYYRSYNNCYNPCYRPPYRIGKLHTSSFYGNYKKHSYYGGKHCH